MSEEQNQDEAAKAEAEKAEAQKRFDNLPVLDKGAKTFFDDEKLVFWLGVPLDQVDTQSALLTLDSAKLHLWQLYITYIEKINARIQSRQPKILAPGALDKARELVGRAANGARKLFNGKGG